AGILIVSDPCWVPISPVIIAGADCPSCCRSSQRAGLLGNDADPDWSHHHASRCCAAHRLACLGDRPIQQDCRRTRSGTEVPGWTRERQAARLRRRRGRCLAGLDHGAVCGVGDPFLLGKTEPGQTVLDLGCGAVLDALLAACWAGPTGRVSVWIWPPG